MSRAAFGRLAATALLAVLAIARPSLLLGQDLGAPDEAGQARILNHQLWRFARHSPYPDAYLARQHALAAPDSILALPDGWVLSPAGKQVQVGRLPFGATWFHGRLVVLNTGYYGRRGQEVTVLDPASRRQVKQFRLPSMFPSAVSRPDGYLYVSGGFAQLVFRLDSTFRVDRMYPVGGFAAGLASLDSSHIVVAYMTGPREAGPPLFGDEGSAGPPADSAGRGAIALLDTRTGKVERTVDAGWFPYDVRVAGGRVYVTALGEDRVHVFDRELKPLASVPTGRRPGAMCGDSSNVYVVDEESDQLTVLAAGDTTVRRTVNLRQRGFRYGASPTSCAVAGGRVFVTLAAINAVAILRASDGHVLGYVPTAWYPTRVLVRGGRMVVVSAKGVRMRRPNPQGPSPLTARLSNQYVLELLRGSVAFLDVPRAGSRLDSLSQRVREGSPLSSPAKGPRLPIRHVFFVLKENRTYDQVLGDLPRGDGDSTLTLFGRDVTPNEHRLATDFVTLDRFFTDGEISVLAHSFTTSGYSSPFIQWLGNAEYSGRYRGYPFGVVPATYSPAYLWDELDSAGVSYKVYGEPYYVFTAAYRLLTDHFGQDDPIARAFYARSTKLADITDRGGDFEAFTARWADSAGTREKAARLLEDSTFACGLSRVLIGGNALCRRLARDSALREDMARYLSHWAFAYRGWDLSYSDLKRITAWKRDFEKQVHAGRVPAFEYIWLPNDHTAGTNRAFPNPYQLVAQNDAALGAMVETIARSPVWKSSLILVEEDDAQDGPDHVDATRTVALAAGPYVERGAVVHAQYDQLSLLRTIELLLGVPPLNLEDGLAVPMFGILRSKPDTTPYVASAPSSHLVSSDRERYERLVGSESPASGG